MGKVESMIGRISRKVSFYTAVYLGRSEISCIYNSASGNARPSTRPECLYSDLLGNEKPKLFRHPLVI